MEVMGAKLMEMAAMAMPVVLVVAVAMKLEAHKACKCYLSHHRVFEIEDKYYSCKKMEHKGLEEAEANRAHPLTSNQRDQANQDPNK